MSESVGREVGGYKLGVRKQGWCEEDQGRGGEECEGGGEDGGCEEGVSVRRE